MRRLALALLSAARLAGCNAAGEPSGARTFSDENVPFTFEIPADFTNASVDDANSRGDVVAAAGVSKVDVIAVRRPGSATLPAGPIAHTVLGEHVTSELHRVRDGYALECQYTPAHRRKILDACARALATIKPR
jgi:hypothetical protein